MSARGLFPLTSRTARPGSLVPCYPLKKRQKTRLCGQVKNLGLGCEEKSASAQRLMVSLFLLSFGPWICWEGALGIVSGRRFYFIGRQSHAPAPQPIHYCCSHAPTIHNSSDFICRGIFCAGRRARARAVLPKPREAEGHTDMAPSTDAFETPFVHWG